MEASLKKLGQVRLGQVRYGDRETDGINQIKSLTKRLFSWLTVERPRGFWTSYKNWLHQLNDNIICDLIKKLTLYFIHHKLYYFIFVNLYFDIFYTVKLSYNELRYKEHPVIVNIFESMVGF